MEGIATLPILVKCQERRRRAMLRRIVRAFATPQLSKIGASLRVAASSARNATPSITRIGS
jgi:hypothetical protein